MTCGARLKRLALELLLVVSIVGGVQAWRMRDLLPTDRGSLAPAFDLRDLDGRRWTNASLAGRPAVVYFFAPWCHVCAASSPQLRWFHRLRGDGVRVITVGLDWNAERELRDYASRHSMPMPVLAGDAATAPKWRISAYPTYYVLDRRGRIVRRDVGFATVAGLWIRTHGL